MDFRRGRHEVLLGGLGPVELARDDAAAEHDDAVADRPDLHELGGDEQDADALGGQGVDDLEHFALGADVDAPGRLVQHQDLGPGEQVLADDWRSVCSWVIYYLYEL